MDHLFFTPHRRLATHAGTARYTLTTTRNNQPWITSFLPPWITYFLPHTDGSLYRTRTRNNKQWITSFLPHARTARYSIQGLAIINNGSPLFYPHRRLATHEGTARYTLRGLDTGKHESGIFQHPPTARYLKPTARYPKPTARYTIEGF